MAMFGWRTSKMAEHYTRKAEQKRLAGGAMHLIDFERDSVQLSEPSRAKLDFSGNRGGRSMPYESIGAQERTRTFTSCKTGT